MSSRLSRRAPVTLAVLGYLIVGVLYLEALPPWEAPDEPLHLAYAEALVAGRLPAAEETWEAHHPPLYYLLPALALRVAGVEAVARAPGNPRMPFATAAVWHAPDDPAIGILRLVRAFSSLIGSLAVVLAWAASREVFRGAVMRPALAACLVALLPQYLFITHSVSSDTLAAVVGALAVYVLVGWASGRLGDKTAASALAVVAVLGLYTKLNTLPVLAASLPIALGLVIVRRRAELGRREVWRPLGVPLAAFLGVAFAAIALWMASPDLVGKMLRAFTLRAGVVLPELARPPVVIDLVSRTLVSLYGRFGWQTIDVPAAGVAVALGALAILAAMVRLRRQPPSVQLGLLGAVVIVLVALAAHVKSGMADPQAQGRLLFPVLAAIALLVSHGVWVLVPSRARWMAVAGVAVGLAFVNIHATQRLLPRSFAAATGPPPQVDIRVVPQRETTRWLGSTNRHRMWQPFRAGEPGLSRIEVAVSEVVGAGDLVLTLRDESGRLTAEHRQPLSELPRKGWLGFDFGPLHDSQGRRYVLELEVLPAGGGGWVEVYVTEGDYYPEGVLTWDGGSGTDLVMITYAGDDAPKIVP